MEGLTGVVKMRENDGKYMNIVCLVSSMSRDLYI